MVKIAKISQNLITGAAGDEREMKALALAFAIKATILSGDLHNATYSNIANMFHIGRESAKERILCLQEMGLIVRREAMVKLPDGTKKLEPRILFKSLKAQEPGDRDFSIQDHSKINITNLKDVEKFLRLQAVAIKQSHIDWAANLKNSTNKVKSLKELRSNRRKLEKTVAWDGPADNGMSIGTVMAASGLRRNSAVNLLKWGESLGFLRKIRRMERIGISVGYDELIDQPAGRGKYFVTKAGFIYRVSPNILLFSKAAKAKSFPGVVSSTKQTLKDRIVEKRMKLQASCAADTLCA